MRVAGRLVVVAAAVAFGVIVTAAPVAACSCAGPLPDPMAAVAAADGAFVGTLVDVDDPGGFEEIVSSGRDVRHRFDVEGVAKGEIGPSVVVVAAAEGASCGIEVAIGQRAGLLLTRDGDRWRSGLCSKLDPDDLLAISAPPRAGPDAVTSGVGPNLAAAAVLGGIAVSISVAVEARTRRDPAQDAGS